MSSPGQIVTGVVGAAVGYMMGGPAGAYYGFVVGLSIGGALFPPETNTPRPSPGQLMIQTSTYGGVVPVVFGSRRISGNLIWIGELKTQEHEEGGGKGGGGGGAVSYTYSISMAWGICMGPKTVTRAWAGKDEITDTTFRDCATIYTGNQTAPDPLIAAAVPRAPVWKNLCYVVLNDYPLGNSPALPNFTFEVTDIIDVCFENVGERTDVAGHAKDCLIYADGYVYEAIYSGIPAKTKIYKINAKTLATETSVEYAGSAMSSSVGCLIDLAGQNKIALAASDNDSLWYIWEFDKSDLSLARKIAIGDVVQGTDGNLYQCKISWTGSSDTKPITGALWQGYWRLLDPAVTHYTYRGPHANGTMYRKGVAHAACKIIFDGSYYYISQNETVGGTLFKIDYSSGAEAAHLKRMGKYLVDGGSHIWMSEGMPWGEEIYKIRKSDLSIVGSFYSSGGFISDMVKDGDYLYYSHMIWPDYVHWYVRKFNTVTGEIVDSWTTPYSIKCLLILKDLLLVGRQGQGPVKLDKDTMETICSINDITEWTQDMATDGTYVYANQDYTISHGLTKFAVAEESGDVTPQSITKAITTNPLWGLGLDASIWETEKTGAAEAFAVDKDLLMSVIFDHQRSVLDALQYVLQHHDGFITYMDGKLAHRQLTMEGESVKFTLSSKLTDNFNDGATGPQWERLE